MNESVIEVTGLRKRFRRDNVLCDLDLRVQRGTTTVLLGPNGAGKSTLLHCLLGTLKPDAGRVLVLGHDPVVARRAARERVGYVPDVPDAEPWMTPLELFAYFAPHYPTWSGTEAQRLLDAFGVPAKVPFKQLSRGQGMKAMMAAALAPSPELVILDEPFAGLDPIATDEVLAALLGEVRTETRTVLCATHDLEVTSRIADRVAILHEGRIQREGLLADVLEAEGETGRGPTMLRRVFAETVLSKEPVQ